MDTIRKERNVDARHTLKPVKLPFGINAPIIELIEVCSKSTDARLFCRPQLASGAADTRERSHGYESRR
jgi:hypothetical protein